VNRPPPDAQSPAGVTRSGGVLAEAESLLRLLEPSQGRLLAGTLSAFMGHSSIKVTFDLYGHLMPGTAQEAAALLDSYLGRGSRGRKTLLGGRGRR
jgi:hypothetical protein